MTHPIFVNKSVICVIYMCVTDLKDIKVMTVPFPGIMYMLSCALLFLFMNAASFVVKDLIKLHHVFPWRQCYRLPGRYRWGGLRVSLSIPR